jgi:signal peptide peptidase SppA
MKTYPRITAALFAQPWAILEANYDSLCTQFMAHLEGKADLPALAGKKILADATDRVGPCYEDDDGIECLHPQVQIGGGIALVPIHGILGKGLSTMDMMCGGYDVSLLEMQLKNIAEDPSIRAVVLDFDSPGGSVQGIGSAAVEILSVRAAGKKCYAYTGTVCASAAYWLASACDELHAEPSAMVGSISVIMKALDNSAEWAQRGWKAEIFTTGKFKAMGAAGVPWTDEWRANVMEKMNAVDAKFKGFIRAQRGLTDEQMQGQWWHAIDAPAGLVDSTAFASLDCFMESVYLSLYPNAPADA